MLVHISKILIVLLSQKHVFRTKHVYALSPSCVLGKIHACWQLWSKECDTKTVYISFVSIIQFQSIEASLDEMTTKYQSLSYLRESLTGSGNKLNELLHISSFNDSETEQEFLEIDFSVPTQIPAALRLKLSVLNTVIKNLRGFVAELSSRVFTNRSPRLLSPFPLFPWLPLFQGG